jgi:hypothetical protein
MSKIANGILGLTAGALALGAVHLDYARSGTLPQAAPTDAAVRTLYDVDRSGKGDRLNARVSDEASATMFVYPVTMPNMLIAARVTRKSLPAAAPARKAPAEKSTADNKIACEPLMSILVVEAENLAPGRCLV